MSSLSSLKNPQRLHEKLNKEIEKIESPQDTKIIQMIDSGNQK